MTFTVWVKDTNADFGFRMYIVKRVNSHESAACILYAKGLLDVREYNEAVVKSITERVTVVCE